MGYWLYYLLSTAFLLLALPLLPLLLVLGSRYRDGLWQRLGFYSREVGERLRGGGSIWIHGASVGEVLSVESLIPELKRAYPGRKIVLSTSTATGQRVALETVRGCDGVILLPLDHPWIIRRAVRLLDPWLLIFLERELWPSLLRIAHRRGIPTFLVSGRLSLRSFRRYFVCRWFFSGVVRQLTAAGMQSDADARRLVHLGMEPRKVATTGSLKRAAQESPGAMADGRATAVRLPKMEEHRQVLVVGSTHRGEEELFLDVFFLLKADFPSLLMVLAPRHPHRFSEVEKLMQSRSVHYEKKSRMNGGGHGLPDVIFLDTIGDLPAFYSLADVAFVGGSLVDAGGHNLLEPARWRKPILFGPHMTNFSDIAAELKRRGGGIEVKEKEDLIRTLSELLTDRGKAREMGELAFGVVEGDRGVVHRTMSLVSRYL